MRKEKRAEKFDALQEEAGYVEEYQQYILGLRFPKGYILEGHIAVTPPGAAKPPHRHVNEAVICCLEGQGYTSIQELGEKVKQKMEWKPGRVFLIPSMALHDHVNTGGKPARFVAIYARGPGMFPLYEKAFGDRALAQQFGIPDVELLKPLLQNERNLLEQKTLEAMEKVFR